MSSQEKPGYAAFMRLRRLRHLLRACEALGCTRTLAEQEMFLLLAEASVAGCPIDRKQLRACLGGSDATLDAALARLGRLDMLVGIPGSDMVMLDAKRLEALLAEGADGNDDAAQCFYQRRTIDLGTLKSIASHLSGLVRDWETRGKQHGVPDLEPNSLSLATAAAGADRVHLIDVASADPADYHVRVLGDYAAPVMRMMSDRSRRMGSLMNQRWRPILTDYAEAKAQSRPTLHAIEGRTEDGTRMSYLRLLMPFRRTQDGADTLIVAIAEQKDALCPA